MYILDIKFLPCLELSNWQILQFFSAFRSIWFGTSQTIYFTLEIALMCWQLGCALVYFLIRSK